MTFPEIYVLRHGETEWNAQDRMQGWLNSPLTAKGLMDAARQHEIMRGQNLAGFDVVSSPSGRAFQTAGIALGPLVEEIQTDKRLREIGVGEWAGRLRAGLPQFEEPDGYLQQYDQAPGGEGMSGLEKRVSGFLADVSGPMVLITHGVTSRMLRWLVIGEAALDGPGPNGGQGCVYHLKEGVQTLLR